MGDLEIVIAALFVSAAVLNAVANWLEVPYPIPLVIGGLVLGLVPGIPHVQLDPDLVLLVFLPPLLYSSAFFVDLRALREDARVISLSAIGLVLATAAVVAVIGHELIGLPWAMSFALGAIVAPTDPAAATAIMRRVGAPRRMVNVLEGESLFNDATALVAYKVAVAAAVGESVSAGHTVLEFFRDAGGGIAIGLAVGWVIGALRKRVTDINTELTISLFSAYGAFVPADQLGVSGVLAVVACGVYLGFRAPEIASPEARMQAYSLWTTIAFLLNAVLFILIGLQLPVDRRRAQRPAGRRGPRLRGGRLRRGDRGPLPLELPRHLHHQDARPTALAARPARRLAHAGRRGWAGMRGAVSLAAALALPLSTDAGDPLPGRELIQFITFALILVTVVGQGLTLPWLIRRLGVVEDGSEEENEEIRARLVIARAALDRVDELETEDWTRDGTVERVRRLYEFRQRRFKIRAGKIEDEDGLEEGSLAYQRMMHEIYAAQRQALVGLRNTPRDLGRGHAPRRARARPGGVAAGGLSARPSRWPARPAGVRRSRTRPPRSSAPGRRRRWRGRRRIRRP